MFKVKYQVDGFMERFKTHLVAQSFFQVYRMNYIVTFISTIRRELLKIFVAIATMLGIILL